jgi:hypothetical protein
MAYLGKKDIGVLVSAGFAVEELGLESDGFRGVEVYETPEDYFAKELIENAAEQGEVDLLDDAHVPIEKIYREKQDTSRPSVWADQEYDGNDDKFEGVPNELRAQVDWVNKIKLGKLGVWQREKNKLMQWPVKDLKVEIPEDDRVRYESLSEGYKRILWIQYAKEEWKRLWELAAMSLKEFPIEFTTMIRTKGGEEYDMLVMSADNIRGMGYENLPPEARWISFVFFHKD